jgi:hypothetical protein
VAKEEKKRRQTTFKINSFVTFCLSMSFLNSDIRLINDVGLLSSIFLRGKVPKVGFFFF